MTERGKFIVFEGLDGCGKTTQMNRLADMLNKAGKHCAAEKEPTEGVIGRLARSAIKKSIELNPVSLAHLFAADRLEHVINGILPQLEKGVNVLCDRFVFSNMAYQSLFLPMEDLYTYNRPALEMLIPDLTLFIDAAPEECKSRIRGRNGEQELFEGGAELASFRENFLRSFQMMSLAKVVFINGNAPEDAVFEAVKGAVKDLLF